MKLIKKHIKLIVLIITCLLVYIIYDNNHTKSITYISLGDGFAVGLNSYATKDYGYSDYLSDYLKKNNKLNKYYDGFSYQDIKINDLYKDILINEKNGKEESLKQALRDSNLLTISIGLNDIIYQKSLANQLTISKQEEMIKNIEKDYKKLIKEIRKYYQYDIYIIGYYNFYPQNSVERSLLNEFNRKCKELSTEKGVNYIETETIFNKNSGYFENPNSFYPNTEGYEQIFNKILEEITL